MNLLPFPRAPLERVSLLFALLVFGLAGATSAQELDLDPRWFPGSRTDIHIEESTTLAFRHAGGFRSTVENVREAELVQQVSEHRDALELFVHLDRLALQDEDPLHPVDFDLRSPHRFEEALETHLAELAREAEHESEPKDDERSESPVEDPAVQALDPREIRAREIIGSFVTAPITEGVLGTPNGNPWVAGLLARLHGARPDGKVGIGDEWTTSERLDIPGLGVIDRTTRYRLEGIEEQGVRQLALIELEISAEFAEEDLLGEGGIYDLLKSEGRGTRTIDLVSGQVTSEQVTLELRLATDRTTLEYTSEITTTTRNVR